MKRRCVRCGHRVPKEDQWPIGRGSKIVCISQCKDVYMPIKANVHQ